jgi:hypothetical protein
VLVDSHQPEHRLKLIYPLAPFGRSGSQAGWTILSAATATASELRNLFTAGGASTTSTAAIPLTQPIQNENDAGETQFGIDFIDSKMHIQHGQFHDDEPDDDIPF